MLSPLARRIHRLMTSGMVLCIAVIASTGVYAEDKIRLSFGLYTSDKPTSLVKKFRPILNSLEQELAKELGKPVDIKLNITKSYEGGIRALVQGEVDFTRLGPASYILAYKNNPQIKLLAMETKQGNKYFNGVICVREDSAIQDITDLRGKRFAFGDERSTIGRYLSQQYLLQHGINASKLASYQYLDRHDKVGYAVAQGKFDAGALKESTLKKLIDKGMPLRAIARFKNVTKPWVAREGLDTKVFLALQKALLNFDDKTALAAIKKDGFTKASHDDYLVIKRAIEDAQAF